MADLAATLGSTMDEMVPGFYFGVSIAPLAIDAAFQEVSGLSRQMDVEEVRSGGENRFGYRLPGRVKYENLVMRRGVALSGAALSKWCADVLDNDFATPIACKDVMVNLFNPDRVPVVTWCFVNAYPVKWSASDLKSQESALLIETIELAYQRFFIV
jgi:phage tail-like protein